MSFTRPKTIICDEIFDENFVPSEKDILDYAVKIGIDPSTEEHLLYIARDGLMQPLPKEWKPCMVENTGCYYYFNCSTGESQWHHPLDVCYKELVKRGRSEGEANSKTSIKEDLRNCEEAIVLSKNMFPSKSEDVSCLSSAVKSSDKLKALGRPPLPPKRGPAVSLNLRLSDPSRDKSSPSPTRIDIDSMPLFGTCQVQPSPQVNTRTVRTKGLKIKGGGSIFLKSNQKQSPSPTNDSQPSLVVHSKLDLLKEAESLESLSDNVHLKSILRDSSPSNKLWDVDPSYMSSEDKMILRSQELEEDRRRSVRFADFEKKSLDLDIRFHIPDSEETASSNSLDHQEDEVDINTDVKECTNFNVNINKGSAEVEQTEEAMRAEEDNRAAYTYTSLGKESGDSEQLSSLKHSNNNSSIGKSNFRNKLKDDVMNSCKINNNILQLLNTNNISDNLNNEKSLEDCQISEKEETCSSLRAYINRGSVIKSTLDYLLNDKQHELKRSISDNNAFNIDDFYERSLGGVGVQSTSDSDEYLDEKRKVGKVKHMPEVDFNKVFESMREVLINSSEHSEVDDRVDETTSVDIAVQRHQKEEEEEVLIVEEDILRLKKEQEKALSQFIKEATDSDSFQKQRILKEMQDDIEYIKLEIEKEKEEMESKLRKELKEHLEDYKKQLDKEKAAKEKKMKESHDEFLKEQENRIKTEQKKAEEETNTRVESSVETLAKFVEEVKEREEKEISRLEKESDKRIKEVKQKTEEVQAEHEERHKQELAIVSAELQRIYAEKKVALETTIAEQETVLQDELATAKEQHEAAIHKAQEQQQARFEQFWAQCQQEEEFMKKKHAEKMEELTNQLKASEKEDVNREFEKVRCEKRLLEDKYRTLKEKYVKLKSEVRLSMERKKQAKLNRQLHQRDTASTTDDTLDHSKPPSARQHNRKPPQTEDTSPVTVTDNDNITSKTIKRKPVFNKSSVKPKNVWYPSPLQRREGVMEADISSADDNHTSVSEDITGCSLSEHDHWDKRKAVGLPSSNPIEGLRKQLEKLEELEEQFPPSTHIDTYLRYPFSGPGASSELEFYRHRLHLERESVRRAKQALAEQKIGLESRQMQLRHKQANSSVQHLQQEERDLTDMEVSLHRTSALLGEKIIRLRYLEQSLKRATPTLTEHHSLTNTLSEPLGATDSSGFSGSDLELSSSGVLAGGLHTDRFWTDTSFSVLQSLENINSEIREIWAILGKQQILDLGPPPVLQYNDMGRATQANYLSPRRATDITERTRGLREWLMQARDHQTLTQ